jgi:predicted nucleotidyltransferase
VRLLNTQTRQLANSKQRVYARVAASGRKPPISNYDLWFDAGGGLPFNKIAVVKRNQIRVFSNAIAREFRPRKIVLFGSYAYGKPTEDSDVDVLVIMPFNRQRGRKSLEIRQRIPADFPLDLIVRTPEFIARRLRWGDCFIQEILAKGHILYETTDP